VISLFWVIWRVWRFGGSVGGSGPFALQEDRTNLYRALAFDIEGMVELKATALI